MRNLADTISYRGVFAGSLLKRTRQLQSMINQLCSKMVIPSVCEVLRPNLPTSRSQRCKRVRTGTATAYQQARNRTLFTGKPKDEAYATAKSWLLENGKGFYDRLQPPSNVEDDLVSGTQSSHAAAALHPCLHRLS